MLKKAAVFSLILGLFLLWPQLAWASASPSHVVTGDGLRLRSGPGTSYDILASFLEGDEIAVIGKQEGWAKVQAGNLEGWVFAQYLRCKVQKAVDAEFLRLRSEPSLEGTILDQAPYSTALSVLEEKEGWSKVLYRDQVGWMKSEFLVDPGRVDSSLLPALEHTQVKFVTVGALNVRSGPDVESPRVDVLSGGTLVKIVDEENGWCLIEHERQQAWVFGEYLADTDPNSIVTALGGQPSERAENAPVDIHSSRVGITASSDSLIVSTAEKYLGIPYVWGGASPEVGFDCSGFVMYVFGELGISLPHGAEAISNYGAPVEFANLLPGDVIFFQNTYRYGISHLGIWVGDNIFIHAPEPGNVISYEKLEGFYLNHYWGARRLIP